jgi:subtilisin family serine protease
MEKIMKISIKKMSVLIVFVLLIMLVGISPAFGRTNSDSRVWVEYENGHKVGVEAQIRGMGGQFHYSFDRLDSFVVSMPPQAIEQLSQNPLVVSIEEDPVRSLVSDEKAGFLGSLSQVFNAKKPVDTQVVPYGIDMVQARDIWDVNRDGKIDRKAPTGAGRTVCIIDTGFYDEHEDLANLDIIGGYSQTNGEDTELWTRDGHGHGTHVAGTINADLNRLGVVGVSPGEASLYIVKIFGDDGLWVSKAHASDLVDAIYRCSDAGANVISMSLSGTTASGKERMAFDELYEQGILHVAAASNDGIDVYHYPASYDSVISVAAIDSEYEVADFSQFNDQVELAAPGVGVLSTIPYVDISTVTVGTEVTSGYHVEYAGRGTASGALVDGGLCTSTGNWDGNVVLCYRGEISFYDKVMNVQNSGGVAAVIYNNLDEELFATLGDGNSSEIVAISLSQLQGQNLLISVGEEATVYSEYIWPTSGYEAWGGTSMATPHVSGVAALIWSANPDWTNVEIREAMAATAMDLGDEGRDVHYGFGLVQAYDALEYLQGNN